MNEAEEAKEDAATAFAAEHDLVSATETDDDGNPLPLEGVADVKADVDAKANAAATQLVTDVTGTPAAPTFPVATFPDLETELQDEAIEVTRQKLQFEVNAAQAEVNSSDQKDLATAKPLVDAQQNLVFADNAAYKASAAFGSGDLTSFTANNDGKNLNITSGTDVVIAVINGKPTITSAGEGVEGIGDALTAAITLYNAQNAVVTAKNSVVSAVKSTLSKQAEGPVRYYEWDATADSGAGAAKEVSASKVTIEFKTDGTLAYLDTDGTTYVPVVAAVTAQKPTAAITAANATKVLGTVVTSSDGTDSAYPYQNTAISTLNDAGTSTVNLDTLSGVNTPNSAGALYAALLEAQNDQDVFDAAVAKWEVVRDLQKAFNEAMDAEDANIEEAQEALDAAIEAVEANADGAHFVQADADGNAVATDADDLFVYTDETLNITKFGQKGLDKLYVGQEFKLTEVANRADIKAQADDKVLEIFVFQEAGNTVLAFEDEVYSGSVAGSLDLTEVTLVGVNANEIVLDNGFITA